MFWGKSNVWKALLYPQLLLLQAISAVVAVLINLQKRITFLLTAHLLVFLQQFSNVFIV